VNSYTIWYDEWFALENWQASCRLKYGTEIGRMKQVLVCEKKTKKIALEIYEESTIQQFWRKSVINCWHCKMTDTLPASWVHWSNIRIVQCIKQFYFDCHALEISSIVLHNSNRCNIVMHRCRYCKRRSMNDYDDDVEANVAETWFSAAARNKRK